MLNSTPVHSTERRDAEVGYVKMIDTLIGSKKGKKEDWGRYEELKKVHGVVDVSSGVVNLRVGHLRSRLYSESIIILASSETLNLLINRSDDLHYNSRYWVIWTNS